MSPDALDRELAGLARPVVVVSTSVGRGMYSIGEALVERLGGGPDVHHLAVEDALAPEGVREDKERYRAISCRFPVLLNLVYRFPFLYWRKLWRESRLATTDVRGLERVFRERGARTVLCVSHRPAFWSAFAKLRSELDVTIVGLLGEYGRNLGWRYVPWRAIRTFLSPVPADAIGFELPAHVRFARVDLPARAEYAALAATSGDPDRVLVVCGLWGQGDLRRLVGEVLAASPEVRVDVVCGENEAARRELAADADQRERVAVHGVVASLAPFLERCGSVVTKPGISTLLEAHASGRRLFVVRGMPVAEDNNLRHALRAFGATPFTREAFRAWHASVREPVGAGAP
ncbi:MAG: hypothetical protein R3F34_15950 [Planctomycetota bacterium]